MAADKPPVRILELGPELDLPAQHMNVYFSERRWQGECVTLPERQWENLNEWIEYYQDTASVLRVPTKKSPEVLQHFPNLPTHVNWLKVTDSLFFEKNTWWPRLFLYESLRHLVVREFPQLDTSLYSYVIGANHKGRAAVAALAGLGYSKIILVDEDTLRLASEVQLLKRYIFGIEIEAVPAHTLTMQEKPGTMMINTLKMQDHGAVLGVLSYFNFMKTGGAVVDISECTLQSQLLDEALRADLQVLPGLNVQSYRDVSLLQKLFPQQYITFEDYFESFSEHLSSLKNPSSV